MPASLTVERKSVRSGGVNIAYSVQGSGPRTVLLVMGLGGRSADWGTALPSALAERFRVVRFDNRGTGASDKPRDAFTLEDMTRDAISVLDAVGAQKSHVVGISMGGMIAQLLALDHAERVDHLVLMSTHFGGFNLVMPGPEVASIFMRQPDMSRDEIVRNATRLITAPGFADKHPEAIEELVRLALVEPTPNAIFGSQLQAVLGSDRSARVSSIRAPTLILHGDVDPLIPFENGRRLAQAMPNARFEVLKGCGHLPMWEACDDVVELLFEFLPAD